MEALVTSSRGRRRWPLYVRVTLGAAAGIALGSLVGPQPIVGGLGLGSLAEAGMLVVRALKLERIKRCATANRPPRIFVIYEASPTGFEGARGGTNRNATQRSATFGGRSGGLIVA